MEEEATTMDFSLLTDAIASKSYDKIADICDNLMLQVSAEGVNFQNDWPYAIHLLGHIYAGDINSARFVWKSMPLAIKENQPEVIAVWGIGQKLWTRDYAGVYEAIRSFDWSPQIQPIVAAFSDNYTKKMFQLLVAGYSTISVQDTALFLGMSEDDVTKYVLVEGWSLDSAARMFTVKKQSVTTEQKLDPSKLQRLTEYVFHLEH
ncbi:COP9 signalosome complex subunit 8-like [Chenopodium quinoa]|uniref:COP9 signalosome complex subunit 8 n=1 Tax=Chenopodium quinoa TaxID=63459 RepID=A0A803LSN2_CHEQI|nr:COP9 signalosome complex subunit 8-like [Chenopodium quinoa]